MAIRIVRLGSKRVKGEGVRLGTVRRPPRGVKKTDYASRDYYDAWLPDLAPSAELMEWYREKPGDERWAKFAARYRREMAAPDRQRLLEVFARLSHGSDFSMGCYCERPDRCHRSLLAKMLAEHGAAIIAGWESG
ncbi:MAG: DUF488 domain-containing protein [Usitatibacter sp.]